MPPLSKNALRWFAAAGLALSLPSQAMYLNPQGSGQVLLFPYYTVNAGQVTLFTLRNDSDRAKAIKLKWQEAYNGRETLDLNLFLGPHDSWSATLYAADEHGVARLLTRDGSCTAPDKHEWTGVVAGGWTQNLFDYSYTYHPDTGPSAPARTREGFLTVVELAELDGALAAAVDSDGARRCDTVRNITPTSADLSPPGGGLSGSFAVVDVAQGTILGGSATAIADFSRYVLFNDTGGWPNPLVAGSSEPDWVNADLFAGGRPLRLQYPNGVPNQAIDAVSALLMADSLQADITREASVGSFSEWVLTAPTKPAYTDNLFLALPLLTTEPALPPYRQVFGSVHRGASCEGFRAEAFDREGRAVALAADAATPDALPPFSLCRAVDVVHFGPAQDSGLTPVLGSRLGVKVWNPQPAFDSGSVRLSLGGEDSTRYLRPDRNGLRLRGLPLIGFSAIKYINANVVPGVLASYTYALPLSRTVVCGDAAAGADSCR